MGIPPRNIIEELNDPRGPYNYVIYCGYVGQAYYQLSHWLAYFEEITGSQGLNFGDPFFYSTYTKKLYFKEKDFAFFWIKFGHMFDKRPWEV